MKGQHIDDGGDGGVPVVLHHGLGADLEVWRSQIDHLRRSRRVLAFDMRGHGRSPKASEYTVAAVVGDLDEVSLPVVAPIASTGSSTSTRLATRAMRRRRSGSTSATTMPA